MKMTAGVCPALGHILQVWIQPWATVSNLPATFQWWGKNSRFGIYSWSEASVNISWGSAKYTVENLVWAATHICLLWFDVLIMMFDFPLCSNERWGEKNNVRVLTHRCKCLCPWCKLFPLILKGRDALKRSLGHARAPRRSLNPHREQYQCDKKDAVKFICMQRLVVPMMRRHKAALWL